MPGRPPSPSLAPPRSLRTRLFRQGAKNFCCAKLGPCRVFAFLLAFGQNLSGFRITRQAKGAGHEQTEVIMSNFELQKKAVKAATRFIERKGYELLETGWTSPEGTQIDLVANDEDTLVFIDVTAIEYGEGGFEGGKVKRGDLGARLRVSASHFAAEHAARTGDNDNFTGKINIQRQIHSSSTSFQSVVFKEIYRSNGAGRITR